MNRRKSVRTQRTRVLYIAPKSRSASHQNGSPELKLVSYASSKPVDTASAVQLLNGCSPGTGINQRIGRQIRMVRLEGTVTMMVTPTTGVDQRQRLLIVLDRQANGVAPSAPDVLEATTVESPPNVSNQKRFTILYDRRFALNASAEPGSQAIVNMSLPLDGRIVQYGFGGTDTVADIVTNSLYMIVLGSEAAGTSAGTAIYNLRTRFVDV